MSAEHEHAPDEQHPDVVMLRRHIREAHPNLLGAGPDNTIAFSPLPESHISRVPYMWLHAIHEANHIGLYRAHHVDTWTAGTDLERQGR